VELRHLRYFVAVADERHFGRAAATLYVSQPSLSFAIKGLERELGVQLFRRHARGVDLTEAGAALLADARRTVRQADKVVETAALHRSGQRGRLRVAFQAAGAGELSTVARAEFSRRHPEIRIEPKRVEWSGEVAALRNDEADVAFLWLPAETDDLHVEVVAEEPRYAALDLGHALADRKELRIDELNDYPIMWTARAPRFWVDWWAVNPRPDGSEPTWGPTNDNVEEMLEQVAAGVAYCTSPESVARFYARPDLVWIPIVDIEPLQIALAWRADDGSPLLEPFAAVVRELAPAARRATQRSS
jgi:DNA-binding transcriptional LysR family regulator